MDNLTHSLIGVALSRAGLNRLTPQAGWLMLLAANAPDIDAVTGLSGSLHYLEHHRGWTHSVVWSPVAALLPLAVWWLIVRKRRLGARQWISAYALSLIGVVSHFLMDWTNVYGVRLLEPFTPHWYRLDWVNIIDLWIWIVLGVAAVAPLLKRLVYAEIGAKGGVGRAGACTALVLLLAYLCGRWVAHDRAVATLESRVYSGETPRRAAAIPGTANPFRWRGVVETNSAWHVVDVNLLGDFDPDGGRIFYKPAPNDAMRRAAESETGRVFLQFAAFPVWAILPGSEGERSVTVQITDLRFGLPEDGRFTATIDLDGAGRIVKEGFEFGNLETARR